ncbi:MAG TPA: phosphoribosylformylglycinamidine synthase [Desulfobacteraceae bacterium]|nr:phosphoribosylformylglycinamidine synthase [Desulfobacteraceae bacterium]
MTARLEIRLKRQLADAEGLSILRKSREYFGFHVDDIRTIRVLTIDIDLDETSLERIRTEIFTNPVTEESSFSPMASSFDWVIWVGFRPGVRDTAGSTAAEAIEDVLGVILNRGQTVYCSKQFEIKGKINFSQAEIIAKDLLANDLIQQWKIYRPEDWDQVNGVGFPVPKVLLNRTPRVCTIPIDSDEELKKLSAERSLALHDRDIPVIRRYFLRKDVHEERLKAGLDLPTDVELEYISQARSDHCNHNTFRGLFHYRDISTGEAERVDNLFKTCIEAPTLALKEKFNWVVSVLWDNAGVGRFDEENYYVITGETHNSPSNMEAYGGAITGIVGIYRDPLGTGKGAKLIMGTYGFCTAPRDYNGELKPHLHPRRLLDGIIEGVRDGGNKSGIPTPYGQLLFDDSYLGKCLVFVTALGIMPAYVGGTSSHEKTTRAGDLIVMCGGRVGKDGIHGVTASSEVYGEHTPAGHVQIGDPYTQKKMHDFLLEARDEGLIAFITDNGGGGLSSSIGESARFSNGARVELDRVPLKYEGLDQWEIWVSESQERMTVAVKPGDIERFMELSRKHAVESTVIGTYTDTGYLHLVYQGATCAYVRMDLLESDFPQWEFEAEWTPPALRGLTEPVVTEPSRHGDLLCSMLSRPNICSRNWIARQYDHEVQGGSVLKPLVGKYGEVPGDAAVMRPRLESIRGIAVSQALNPGYSRIDTYHMTTAVIDEAVRKVLAVGGNPHHLGGVDNFCWPTIEYNASLNPDGKYKAAQLVRANWALRDCCMAYGIPLLSGKDSMYIDGNLSGPFGERRKVSGLPTLLFTVCSVIEDVTVCPGMDAKEPGDLVYLLGDTRDELGGGEFYQMLGAVGLHVPKLRPEDTKPCYEALHRAVIEGLTASCHAVGRGGLGVHLALVAIAGDLGMELSIEKLPGSSGLTATRALYSESSGRFVITVPESSQKRFEEIFVGLPLGLIGKVNGKRRFIVHGNGGTTLIDETLEKLRVSWLAPFGDLI